MLKKTCREKLALQKINLFENKISQNDKKDSNVSKII